MKRYDHGGNIYAANIKTDFSVNTNPRGLCEDIKNAVLNSAQGFGLYPDKEYRELKGVISKYEGVKYKNIALSNGASEMIFALVRALEPKRALLISPTFSEYERALKSVGSEISYYKTLESNDFAIGGDVVKMAEEADITFICNPNNPTGSLCDKAILDQMARENIMCVVDECFLELSEGVSMKDKLPVIKAFTKTYAMAGLRFGYLIGDTKLIEKVNDQLPPWNVSSPAAAAAMAAADCKEYLRESKELIEKERQYLGDSLESLGFKVYPSRANFLLIRGEEGIGAELRKRGILIRECDNFNALDSSYYRVAVKSHGENEILIKELGDICG